MNEALALAAVTAALKSLLENAVVPPAVAAGVGDVVVSALPPDRITLGAEERSQLNLYLYRVTPDSSWRPGMFSSVPRAGDGAAPRRPLALELHYLLTAYGERDVQAEILLGYAMQALYDAPMLTAAALQAALAADGTDAALAGQGLAALVASAGILEQVEQAHIRPEFLSLEDLSKLWSALQAHCRLSATYEVSLAWRGPREDGAGDRRGLPQGTTRDVG